MVEFVVQAFIGLVGFLLVASFIVAVLIVVFTDNDVTLLLKTLTDVTTTIVGALIGFIAGKSSAQADAAAQQQDAP